MSRTPPHHTDVFTGADYDAFFALLADCGASRSLRDLRRTLLDSLARRFGHRDTTVFLGSSLSALFQDDDPEFEPLIGKSCAGGIGLLAREHGEFGAKDRVLLELIGTYLPPMLDARMLDARMPESDTAIWAVGLTPAQHKVARLILQGHTNLQIARELVVGVDTVKKHVTAILRVAACTSRTQFVAMALAL